jgi:hypothetical protein
MARSPCAKFLHGRNLQIDLAGAGLQRAIIAASPSILPSLVAFVAAPGDTTGAGGEGGIGLTSGLFVDARKIAKALKRTPGATQQKAFTLGVSLDSRP